MDRLGINTQTLFGMPPVDHVNLAADLGCGHISTGLSPVPWKLEQFPDWSLRDDPRLQRELRAALKDRGIAIAFAEGCIVRPQVDVSSYAADLDLFAELGAQGVSTVCMEPDTGRALDQLATLAELSTQRTMSVAFEFAPPHTFNTLGAVLSVVEQIGSPNIALLIDAMHFLRTGGTLDQLAAIDPGLIGYVQLCDAPLAGDGEDYYREASFERQCPGEGELPLRDLLAVVPVGVLIGLEVPMLSRIQAGIELKQTVDHLVRASRRLLDASNVTSTAPSH
jgi:sugar phosphate isomerase/epimerase